MGRCVRVRDAVRVGGPAAQLKQFIDQAGGLWRNGTLADKPVTAFTSAFNRHGGNEATEGPDAATLEAARYQGRRLAQITIRQGCRDADADGGGGSARATLATTTSRTA